MKLAFSLTLLAGVVMCAAALALSRSEAATGPAGVSTRAPLSAALAMFFAWMALIALTIAGVFVLGLIAPLSLAAAALVLARLTPTTPRLMPFYFLKLPLAATAMIAAITAWLGVLSLFGGSQNV